ncbi:hypothetical protein EBR43_13435, partial [bacterium]|nr:hypothetical protein [bacterium]
IAKTLSGNTSKIFLDFDKTLAFGADKINAPKIKGKKGQIDYSGFNDPKQITQALSKAKLSSLGLRLRKLVGNLDQQGGLGSELLRRMFVVSARPQRTMPLIARWIRNQGLRIPPNNVVGVGGIGISPAGIAIAKAEKIAEIGATPGSAFIDDDPKNISATRKNITSYLYGSRLSKKGRRDQAVQEGYKFEELVNTNLPSELRTALLGRDKEGIDFPLGLSADIAKNWFNDSRLVGIPVDTKRTLDGPRGKIKNNVASYLKAKGYAIGGSVEEEDYYGKQEVESARKALKDFKRSVKRAFDAENIRFAVPAAKSIAAGVTPEVYGTGIGSLPKGQPGIVGSKEIRLASEKIKKAKPRMANVRSARNLIGTMTGVDKESLSSMSTAQLMGFIGQSGQRAPASAISASQKRLQEYSSTEDAIS